MQEMDPGASAPASLRSTGKGMDFAAFFEACWGVPPFAWQTALAHRVTGRNSGATGSKPETDRAEQEVTGWPEAIALPTAAGKTACVDIAVFALAAQADRAATVRRITAPRRVFFVVDRRIIVDEAHQRAQRLARKLEHAGDGIVRRVADNLRSVAHGSKSDFEGKTPLAVHLLRGGMYRSEAWARNPLQPMVVASTVDQVGSRLLFRAYGRGPSTWPIYAGLVANDSIVFLDEAHCAQPFWQTLRAVGRFRGEAWAQTPLGGRFHPVVMSATPPPGIKDIFHDPSEEGRDPHHTLGQRQLARKPASLRSVDVARHRKGEEPWPKRLADEALGLLGDGRQAIVVFVNRVSTARAVHRNLSSSPGITRLLLTGRMRPVDKERVWRRMRSLQLSSTHAGHRTLDQPVVVVATQTLEVGADLDFDGLVTTCASLDALRQRFGRLNRTGRNVKARGSILIRASQTAPGGGAYDDPIYGTALTKTWQWLDGHKDDNGQIDFGIRSMDKLLSGVDSVAKLAAPSIDAPVLLPAHIDCLAQTSPQPEPTPDVSLFLRGPRAGAPDVLVCWRADIDLGSEEKQRQAMESLRLCPPSSSESLPVPVGVFRRWLVGRNPQDNSGDVEATCADEGDHCLGSPGSPDRRIVRWRGTETRIEEHVTKDPSSIRPSDILVIPTTHPGQWSELGDIPPEAAPTLAELDVGDPGHRMARAKPILRLHPALVEAWPQSLTAKATIQNILGGLEHRHDEDPEGLALEVRNVLVDIANTDAELPDRWSLLPETARELIAEFSPARFRQACHIVGPGIIVAGRQLLPQLAPGADMFSDEDDALASGTSRRYGKAVQLTEHLRGVEDLARRHAAASGLGDDLINALGLAGLLHDSGKADPRFQAMLRGGTRWHSGSMLAKSATMPQTRWARRRAREEAGYPAGRPHPLLSAHLAERHPKLRSVRADIRDLVVHLVASHHGQCRPFAPVIADDDPVNVLFHLNGTMTHCTSATEFLRLDSGVADRYWQLTRRYGWWGLAWLEALLRLADWRRSAFEEVDHV